MTIFSSCSCVPELRPASTVPVVALVVALIGTLTCLALVLVNNRKTKKALTVLREDRLREQEAREEEDEKLRKQISMVEDNINQQIVVQR